MFLLLFLNCFPVLINDEQHGSSFFMNALIPSAFATAVFALISGAFFGRCAFGEYWKWDFHLTSLLIQAVFLFASMALTRTQHIGASRSNDMRRVYIILLGTFAVASHYFYFDFFVRITSQFLTFISSNTWIGFWVQLGIFFMAGLFYCMSMFFSRMRTIILEYSSQSVWAREGALFGEL